MVGSAVKFLETDIFRLAVITDSIGSAKQNMTPYLYSLVSTNVTGLYESILALYT